MRAYQHAFFLSNVLTFSYYYVIRVRVHHVYSATIMSLLYCYILLQFLHFITLLDVDNYFYRRIILTMERR